MTIRFLGAGKSGAGLTNQPQGLDVGIGGGGSGTSYAAQFTNFDSYGQASPATTSTWITILNVTGKGYLLDSYVTSYGEIKITIDGMVYYWSYANGWSGIMNIDGFTGAIPAKRTGFSFTAPQMNATYLSTVLPVVTRTQNALAMIGLPIFFNTSLKIEITTTNTAGNPIYYGIRGGYK